MNATQEERLAFFVLCVVDSVILWIMSNEANVVYYSKIRREIEEDSRALGNTFRLTSIVK